MKEARSEENFFRVVIYKEDDSWIAHCLELDLVADAKSVKTALKRLGGVIVAQIEHLTAEDRLDELYFPAPLEYWKRLQGAKPLGTFALRSESKTFDNVPARLPSSEMARMNLKYEETWLCRNRYPTENSKKG